MRKKSTIRLFVIVVFALPLTAYTLLNVYEHQWSRLPVLKESKVADFRMMNQDNKSVNRSAWNDKIVVVDFFFTHCPSICPRMTASLGKVTRFFSNDNEIRIASFSVDPVRDSVAQLKAFAERRKIDTGKWDLLTGDKREIYQLARNGFRIVATDGDGGPEDFIHSEKLVLLDRKGKIRGYYDGTSEAETKQLIRDIKKLKNEKD